MDEKFMKIALEMAEKGIGKVNPNPLVGAVIVKDNRIIGNGYHKTYGGFHAEREALKSCSENPSGATMYVTLEPCCHYGKTPPCVDAIIENGISRVVVGTRDPNPLVAGKGIDKLRKKGIAVVEGVLEAECRRLNTIFFHYIKTKMPYVTLKYAMTIDGKIATKIGASRWISGEESRINVHRDRNRYSAIMIGVNTVLSDDPLLNCRLEQGNDPIRIVCDTNLKTPPDSRIVKTSMDNKTIIVTKSQDEKLIKLYENYGCEVLVQGASDNDRIDLQNLVQDLGCKGIDSILLEGGSTLAWSALETGIVDKVQAYISPKIFGGAAKTPVAGNGIDFPDNAIRLSKPKVRYFGEDILLESEVIKCLQE
ncbi:bifunctional diaminohydroxyphosphoribosylaminopyrimidine deaminase/5-amino-6-(5-phosphoribosylamino)uracil reductase RibD [Peptostreptococcus porci]|uniref:bifunctional diaminohydroxyphosphoribosylaminopyrimidine deaminase/5-amino-6-(5-phosphoribosylamino)uracil reductase RibD n=1 Tax=Peptostreptococcus porci TaxID=2652282 RepID=UPI002A90F7FF|nr:bifunctional diaminohydroxyphosphoribosylaminopyrimidine deaminase/5-amino-6-(5-phosphoribosylamino)uracil reductase RibD [Peptostreptococcus porci]MDY5436888.1 bifunctional diaminohydroxyphosphoribosylaminopyrimidine deaminase/5-amino-6-(5-phosphoribosylamino)uracil reductase RibD [Peptostreptococcus porci]